MSNYRVLGPVEVLNQVITGSDPIYSKTLDVRSMTSGAFSIQYESGLTATLKVEVSLDGKEFDDLGIIFSAISGSSGFQIANLPSLGISYIRMVITPSAGSAQVKMIGTAKGQ